MKCSHESPYGRIVSNWQRAGKNLTMDITIPANTTATVYVPAKDHPAGVAEGGPSKELRARKPAMETEGVNFLRMENGAAVYEVGSGCYRFCTEEW